MALYKTLIVIAGPTGIGKTALAITLARHYATEILSADSRQFFKEMSIGTAKPDATELAAAKHHFIDSHSIHDFFSTGDFEISALQTLEEVFKVNDLAIMVGGSGLYLDAVTKGLDVLPETDMKIREELNTLFRQQGLDSIREQLSAADPEYYAKIDQSNPQRMIRGLEFFLSTGSKVSSYLTNSKKERPFQIIKIGLNTERANLYARINKRVDLMIAQGLLDEVIGLTDYRELNALKTVGYAEFFRYLDGAITLEDAIVQIKQNTRRFAKRQLTWFRRDSEINWFEPGNDNAVISLINEQLTKPAQ
ncbi:tRNA delta(2)-isopentenylpyrophosphate transferase [Pedobacter antarcticus 4BY]|uniref:tRNA dimethylallyltransferase n=2 Tax=Pedobacter antarcticus TaxID=34086 RepID=A0A081PCY5_9SPHI|nr:tRNA (adenosine(37)-N6)-dimethylallyltransferase MiaA [Pedobacter antarcticus]KEQ28558.1 tRNA delta(2)-isopentenylpyrophosphate transferase [Pedobacter antarcticus 4BY]SFF42123.1 tRNA dimethylallyltransferase [Pedobacter antarcticus]